MKAVFPSYVGIIFDGEMALGTGFLADSSFGVLATAYHVIVDAEERPIPLSRLFFQPLGSKSKHAVKTLIGSKPVDQEDVALLEIAPADVQAVPILSTAFQPTSDVWLVGYASEREIQREFKSSQGKIAGPTRWHDSQLLELEISGIYLGMSGAPVHAPDGTIIGVLTDRINEYGRSVALVTPVDVLAALDIRVETQRRRYLKKLIEKIILDDANAPFSIQEYIPIPVTLAQPTKNDSSERFNSVLDLLETHGRFSVIGDAGSGKSAAIRALTLWLARQALSDEALPLPVWINLHNWRDNRESFLDFVAGHLRKNGLEFPLDLKIPPPPRSIILLLDELDELQADNARILNEWSNANECHALIVGCRENMHAGLRDMGLPVATLQPLGDLEVFRFATRSLQDERMADSFTSLIFPKQELGEEHYANLASIVRNPLFLNLSLSDYKVNQWGREDREALQVPTIWQLFERIIQKLWEAKRVKEKLEMNYALNRQFGNAATVMQRLSKIMSNRPGQSTVGIADAEKHLPVEILELLDEARLIRIEGDGKHFRFLHPLFADFFAALDVSPSTLEQHIDNPAWHQVILLLATRDSSLRKFVQERLVEQLPGQYARLDWFEAFRLLGEIGDATVINTLLNLYRQHANLHMLKTVARIANRLPDGSPGKQAAIQAIRGVMFSAEWMGTGDTDVIHTGLDWYVGHYMDGAEAMSLIQSPDALEALLDLLEKTSRYFENRPMGGGLIREQTFASYLGGMGSWAIPRLLEAINSDHEDVSAAVSAALTMLKRPLDTHKLGFALENNPNPRVRDNVAYTLAAGADQSAIPYLERSLNDLGIWSRGGSFGGWMHYYVADTVAYALSQIGTPDAKNILRSYLYEETGEPSIELLLKRLDCGMEISLRNPLRTQIAVMIALRNRSDLLFPRLGNLANIHPDGYRELCPVGHALIRYGESSEAEPGFVNKILDYVESSSDVRSRAWALIVAGHIASSDLYPRMEYFLNNPYPAIIRDAAAYGLCKLHSRFPVSSPKIEHIASQVLVLLESVPVQRYCGVAMGLSTLLRQPNAPANEMAAAQKMARSTLENHLASSDAQAVIAALDIIETLCMDGIFSPEDFELVTKSPSYHTKMGDQERDLAAREGEPSVWGEPDNGRYSIAYQHYQRAFLVKQDAIWDSRGVGEGTWRALGCGDVHLWFGTGRCNIALNKPDEAASAFKTQLRTFESLNAPHPYEKAITMFATFELANITRNTGSQIEAETLYDQAFSLARTIQPHEWYLQRYAEIILDAARQYFEILGARFDYKKFIEVGTLALELTKPYEAEAVEDRVVVSLHVAQIYGLTGDYKNALACVEQVEGLVRRSSRKDTAIHLLIQKALWKNQVTPTYDGEEDARQALAIARRWGSRASITTCLITLGRLLVDRNDLEGAKEMYREALATHETGNLFAEIDKTMVHHQLAMVYFNMGEMDNAGEQFQIALERTRDIPEGERLPEQLVYMPYEIYSDFAKYLHKTGREEMATQMLQDIARDMHENGLQPEYPLTVLREIDQIPGGEFTNAQLKSHSQYMLSAAIDATQKQQFIEHLKQGLQSAQEMLHMNEAAFLNASIQLLEGKLSGSALPKENPYHQHFEIIKAQYMAMSQETATKSVDDVLGIMETLRSAGNKRAAIRKGFEAAVQNAGEGRYEDALSIGEQLLKGFSASFDMSRQDVEAMTQIMNFLSDVRRAQIAQSHLAEIEQIEGEIAMLERENRVTDAAGWRLNLASAWAEMGEFEKAQRQTEQAMDTFRQHNATEELENARRMLHVIQAEALLSDLSDDETVKAATDSIIGLSKEQAAYINAAAASRLGNRGEFQLARECAIRARGLFETLNVAEGVAHTQRIIQRLDEIEGGNADT